jgi:hypothetical protein
MKIGLRELHVFITNELPKTLLKQYKKLQILNESDLQYEVAFELRRFLRHDGDKSRLALHNCLSCSGSNGRTYPDVLIMKRNKPWVVIELKEKSQIKQLTAEEEREKIGRQRKTLKAKRGYLIYLGRWGKHRAMHYSKGPYGFWFYEVPATLERDGMPTEKIERNLDSERK